VRATSINPVDYKIRSGTAKGSMPVEFRLSEEAIFLQELSNPERDVNGFPQGMRVMAPANGTYAEYTVAKADVLAPIPDALSFEEAAVLPLVSLTGAQLIEGARKPEAGHTVLITGALGGVGRAAVHVARQYSVRASDREKEMRPQSWARMESLGSTTKRKLTLCRIWMQSQIH
jgi:NADPH:quinone reductase-like Zn-dependent oxidoreductase